MAPSLVLVATLLSAEPTELHFGGGVGLGVGAPFQNTNAGFQCSVKGLLDFPVAKQFLVGAVLPFGFGFYSSNSAFAGATASASATVIDIMPGVRGLVSIVDWVRVGAELGLGPAIQMSQARLVFGSIMMSSSTTQTAFALRAAFLVEIQPPALSGVMFWVEPVAFHGRFADSHFSEYRFSVGAGYRR